MEIPKIDVSDSRLTQIIADMQKGKLQVPRFQRGFVWPLAKTRALLDSIYKEFPIGTFFLWRVPGDITHFFRPWEDLGIPQPTTGAEIAYILDGQQRLISLFVAINGLKIGKRDYSRICINLDTATRFLLNNDEGFDEEIFVYHKPDYQQYISVSELIGENELTIYDQLKIEWKPAFNKASNLLKTYPFSVVWIQDQDMGSAIEIFERINQGGKKLNRYDLVCANVWREDFDFRAQVEDENTRFESKGFGHLHETIFTQAFSLIIRGNCTLVDELSLETDQIKNSWKKVINAMRLAVDFSTNNLGIKRYEFLPYRGILAVLAYYFYHCPNPDLNGRKQLWQWFWRVTLSERYSSASPSRMYEDAKKFKIALNGQEISFDYQARVSAEDIASTKMSSTSSVLRNATLCLLALKQPRNFKNNSLVNIKDDYFSTLIRAERHHIYPVGFLSDLDIPTNKVHLLPNFCFIPADLNKEIGKKPPVEYLNGFMRENPNFAEAASSHLIPPPDSPIWRENYEAFVQCRAAMIADELKRIAEISPDHVAPVKSQIEYNLDNVELQTRDTIHLVFDRSLGNGYWKKIIPPDIQDATHRKIQAHIQTNPQDEHELLSSDRMKLDFCDFSDYEKIISRNWEKFNDIFIDKVELEKHIDNLRELRNTLKHHRRLTEIVSKNGEAGIMWMEACFKRIQTQEPILEDEEIVMEP